MLGYTSKIKQLNAFNIKQQFTQYYKNLKVPQFTKVPLNFQKNTLFINEFGLYDLLIKSLKPSAKHFFNKYLTEIMPQIRNNGKYILENTEHSKHIKSYHFV